MLYTQNVFIPTWWSIKIQSGTISTNFSKIQNQMIPNRRPLIWSSLNQERNWVWHHPLSGYVYPNQNSNTFTRIRLQHPMTDMLQYIRGAIFFFAPRIARETKLTRFCLYGSPCKLELCTWKTSNYISTIALTEYGSKVSTRI